MQGIKFEGHMAGRAKEIFNRGLEDGVSMGGVPCSIKLGDHGQLEPALDDSSYKLLRVHRCSARPLMVIGQLEYSTHSSQCFEFIKPTRQDFRSEFIRQLSYLRGGTVKIVAATSGDDPYVE